MTTTILLIVTRVAWGLLEGGLRIRDRARGKGTTTDDRGTRALATGLGLVAVAGAVALGVTTGERSPLRVPGAGIGGWTIAAALAVTWLGLAIRVWAIVTLGRSFRTTVEVDAAQAVVHDGPYCLVRHPSYTGNLLIVLAFGLDAGNWLALAICVLLPGLGVLRRIQVEEDTLTRVLGEPYRAYASRTRRLIPGVW